NSKSFWYLKLNSQLFELKSQRVFRLGEDVTFEDMFGHQELQVILFLAEHPYCIRKTMIDAIGLPEKNAVVSDINGVARAFGLPEPVLRTNSKPYLYSVNPKFAEWSGIATKPGKLIFNEIFDPKEMQIILEVLNLGIAVVADICKNLSWRRSDVRDQMVRVENICTSLGLPKPFIASGNTLTRRYELTEEFVKHFGFKKHAVQLLKYYFTPKLIETLTAIAENPLADFSVLASKLGINVPALYHRLRDIEKISKKHGIDSLVRVHRNHPSLVLLKPAFLKRFELPIVAPSIDQILVNSIQKIVYIEELKHRNPSAADTAKALKISVSQVYTARADARKRLNEWNSLINSFREVTVDKPIAKDSLLFFRIAHGRWPNNSDLRDGASNIAVAFGGEYNSVLILARAKPFITYQDCVAIIRADLKKMSDWDFSKFPDQIMVQKAFVGALVRGADLTQLEAILRESKSMQTTILKLNEIHVHGLGLSIEELSPEISGGRATSNGYVSG
ncbi:MAG: hypothetical protein Q7S22_01685, partial [Candidatus Micrarchaeota archaeon]|nr:hypothetical protein [Candidatus Micrarchaeota archaeon]